MDFGVIPAYGSAPVHTHEFAITFAQLAEELGFESIWVVEHPAVPVAYESRYPYARTGRMPIEEAAIPDPLAWLGHVAGVTRRIRLATGVLVLPLRNPLALAKELATLDVLSNGRMIAGVGVGWLAEEFDALDVPFTTRGRRADEYIEALRRLWSDEVASFDGEFAVFDGIRSLPKPHGGGVPIVVGGHSEAAARRAGRLGDGFFPLGGSPDSVAPLFETARIAAKEVGRAPHSLELTATARTDYDTAGRLEDLGVSRVVVSARSATIEESRKRLGEFSEHVIDRMR